MQHKGKRCALIVVFFLAPSYVLQPKGGNRVCQYSELQRLEICKEALDEGYMRRMNFKLSKTADMGKETVYRVQYGGFLSSHTSEETVSACMCPTKPPIYLQDVTNRIK